MKDKLPWIFFSVLLLLGVGLLAYPVVSNYVNRVNGSFAIQTLADTLALTEDAAMERQRELAEDYNRALRLGKSWEGEPYESILDFGNGILGNLMIPKIDVNLPIYHGTGDEVLSRGLGHMSQSAFPIGGEGNHAALVGHTGLPSAKMLDDLVKLELGDGFSVTVLGEELHYQVDQILVVEPEDSQPLTPVPGEDYCTLVTCTPYGVNSHRLLVRGTRIQPVQQAMAVQELTSVPVEAAWWGTLIVALLLGAMVAAGLLLRRIG